MDSRYQKMIEDDRAKNTREIHDADEVVVNKHGVEVLLWGDRRYTQEIPLICTRCHWYNEHSWGIDVGHQQGYCRAQRFLPTRKGTCKTFAE